MTQVITTMIVILVIVSLVIFANSTYEPDETYDIFPYDDNQTITKKEE